MGEDEPPENSCESEWKLLMGQLKEVDEVTGIIFLWFQLSPNRLILV